MPANKKLTNKTAHVLNVITAGRETGDEAPTTPPAALIPSSVPLPTVVEVEHAPEELSNRIREALREELAREGDGSFSVPQPETIQTKDPAAAPPLPSPSAPPAAAAQPIPPVRQTAPQPAKTQSAPQIIPPSALAAAHASEQDASNYVNVMQALVREKVPKYIHLLGVCPCSRCVADVEALALSHLEPKYIVLHKSQKFPFSVYESHYNAAVTSQIISACRVVMENPRH